MSCLKCPSCDHPYTWAQSQQHKFTWLRYGLPVKCEKCGHEYEVVTIWGVMLGLTAFVLVQFVVAMIRIWLSDDWDNLTAILGMVIGVAVWVLIYLKCRFVSRIEI